MRPDPATLPRLHERLGERSARSPLAAVLALALAGGTACGGWQLGPPPDSPWLGRVSFALAASAGRGSSFGPFDPDPSGRYTVEDNPLPGQGPGSMLYLPVRESDAEAAGRPPATLDIHVGQTAERTNDISTFGLTLYGYRGPGAYTAGGDGAGIDVDLVRSDASTIGRWTSDDWRPPTSPGKSWPGATCAVHVNDDRATGSREIREIRGTFSCRGLVRWAKEAQHAEVRDARLDVFVAERWCMAVTPPDTSSSTC